MPKFCTDVKWRTKWPWQQVSRLTVDNWKLTIYGGTLKRFSFPKSKRLVSNKEFKGVLARNLCFSNGLLTLFVAENDCGYPRLGVSVGKSCGNAVVRNRLKRLLRAVFRQSQDRIPPNFDYLLMISPQWSNKLDKSSYKEAIGQLACGQVKTSFLALMNEARGSSSKTVKQ